MNYITASNLVYGHEMELERVFSNLIDNSIYALKNSPNPSIIIRIINLKNSLQIELTDTGVGIDQKILSILGSERVSTKNKAFLGNGIALIHAKRAIENMGGNIKITSEKGLGTTVVIYLNT